MRNALVLLAIVATSTACRRDDATSAPKREEAPVAASSTPAGPRLVRVEPALVDAGRITTARVIRRPATGTFRAPADVVASPEGSAEAGTLLAGRIARFEAREGDRVKRGQVLAWLDAPEAARALADLIRARARTETQAKKAARLEGLVASEAATRLALEETRLELELARADLAAARTVVTSLGLSEPPASTAPGADVLTARLPIRSPADGIVVERTASLGAHVTPSTPLFRLLGEGRVLVEARIPDGGGLEITPSTVARLHPRGGAPCAGVVLGLLPQVDLATRSRRARIAPADACKGLVPGAQVEAEIDVASAVSDAGAPTALVVPAAAVMDTKTALVVFVKGGEAGTFAVRPIEPGVLLGDDRVVRAGVAEGEEVVVEGAVLLKGELMRAELGGSE